MMRIKEVQPDIYEVSLAWSNAYLLREKKGATLIDTGLAQDRKGLLQALSSLQLTPEDVRAVLLTHAHCDHAGNAHLFVGKVRAHTLEVPFLASPRRPYGHRGVRWFQNPLSRLIFAVAERRYPVEVCSVPQPFAEGEYLDVPGGPLRVVHTPGHTVGHCAFYREWDGLLFSGDAVMNIHPHLLPSRRKPGLHLPLHVVSDDWSEAKRTAHKLAELAPAVLLPGHGWPLKEQTADHLTAWAKTL